MSVMSIVSVFLSVSLEMAYSICLGMPFSGQSMTVTFGNFFAISLVLSVEASARIT